MNGQNKATGTMNGQNKATGTVQEQVELSWKTMSPTRLKKSASSKSCCIFRTRQNRASFEPRIVSIGPYHYGKEQLEMIQEHKYRFLDFFLSKTQQKGVDMQELVDTVSDLEQEIRDSYSENLIEFDRERLIHMMLLDGCFILTLFLVVAQQVRYTQFDDPIFKMPWLLPSIRRDLLLLENQVPFFLLQVLFKKSKLSSSSGLNEIAFMFFSYSIEKPKEFWDKHNKIEAKHLLDLIRHTFIPQQKCVAIEMEEHKAERESIPHPFLRLILSAKKLQLRGIKFKPSKNAETLLDVHFKNGVLYIPPMALDDFISLVFLNCIAFEQYYAYSSNHITSYAAFMGCLINDGSDATFLSEKEIIENYFGEEEEVCRFFKNIGKDIVFHLDTSYLAKVFEGVNEYTSKGYHVQWAGFKHTHFHSPWIFASSCAALTLLVLTIVQAFFAAYAYFCPPKG